MYHSPAPPLQRSPKEDDRIRRDSKVTVNTQQLPPYSARSPTQFVPYSPTNGTHPQSPYNQTSSRPSTSAMAMPSGISPRLGPPPSPKSNGLPPNNSAYTQRESSSSTYYDPTSEHREGSQSRGQPQYNIQSPVQVCQITIELPLLHLLLSMEEGANQDFQQSREAASFSNFHVEPKTSPVSYHSPVGPPYSQHSPTYPTAHAHPISRHNSIPQSPAQSAAESPVLHQTTSTYPKRKYDAFEHSESREPNGVDGQRPSKSNAMEEPKTTRTSDPMAFSSILSSNAADPPKSTPQALPASKQFRKSSYVPNRDSTPASSASRKPSQKPAPSASDYPGLVKRPVKTEQHSPAPAKGLTNNHRAGLQLSDKENEKVKKEMAKIDAMELSDIESSKWAAKKQDYAQLSHKRYVDIEDAENVKRKVSATFVHSLQKPTAKLVSAPSDCYGQTCLNTT